ncbi:MAG TPA: hypothetical protein PLT87_07100 [Spirochaetales bacterium]|nr:hypothetical protein [Spirochaetales bacterium]
MIVTGCGAQNPISQAYLRNYYKAVPLNEGPASDYRQLKYWAASPYKDDASDEVPAPIGNVVNVAAQNTQTVTNAGGGSFQTESTWGSSSMPAADVFFI